MRVNPQFVRLCDCPPGLFVFKGALCFRSEYSTERAERRAQPDAYIVESGEYFWGGAKTGEERSELLVQPLPADLRAHDPFDKIFDHKWLDPACVETGCQSLALIEKHAEIADKVELPSDPHSDAWTLGFLRARKMIAEAIRAERQRYVIGTAMKDSRP